MGKRTLRVMVCSELLLVWRVPNNTQTADGISRLVPFWASTHCSSLPVSPEQAATCTAHLYDHQVHKDNDQYSKGMFLQWRAVKESPLILPQALFETCVSTGKIQVRMPCGFPA